MPEDLKPVETQTPVVLEIPKTKDDWNKLREADPTRWANLTQDRMDQTYRESKENKERLAAMELREKNLTAELESLKQKVSPPPPIVEDQPIQYGNGVYPQTENDWNDLFIEQPKFASELHHEYLNKVKVQNEQFTNARKTALETLVLDHADMYHYEMDPETNKPKLDKAGKPIVLKDPRTGSYAFNKDSEKGKLWDQIYHEGDVRDYTGKVVDNRFDNIPNAPELIMAKMERVLRAKGATMTRQNDQGNMDQSMVAPEGVIPAKPVDVKFASEEDRAAAQRSVDRGTYKSLEEYVAFNKQTNMGYAEKNSRPDFTRK